MDKFLFSGKEYEYFDNKDIIRTERIVEIPIFLGLLNSNNRILEVGNVLSHYVSVTHDILDKYEKWDKVINEDVVTYNPGYKYDLVISISTLEHIGCSEQPNEPKKILRAIHNLKRITSIGGKIVFSIPLGWNKAVDEILKKEEIPFLRKMCLRRTGLTVWVEASWQEIENIKYNEPYPNANALVIGEICV